MAIQPALVRAIYPRNELGRGLGFNTTVVATSLAAGPSIGAALLSIASWPILFAAYVPLGIVSFLLSERYLPHTTHTHRPFDVISAVLSGATFGLLIFGIDGMAHGHQRPVIVSELVLAVVLGTLFVWRQKRLADPDDADRRLQAADLLAVDLRRDAAPSRRRAWPSSACPSSSTPCWAATPPTPASC